MSSYGALALAIHVLIAFVVPFHVTEATFFPCPCPAPPPPSGAPATFVVYLQDITAQNGTIPANATTVPVAGRQGIAYNLQNFGTVFVTDDNITATASPNSALLGQAQGTLIVTSLQSKYFQISLTLVFNAGPYANSTVVLLGVVNGLQAVRPVAVVGGTGVFTYAKGFATFETVVLQGSYTVDKVTVTYKIRQ
ncbi:hypothetical protein MLD38_003041 [Melastoma candidum]|uniref:Uncharacterized protein n=1 Tax=Melastoma candidum TaxID=119954 RepID=A0ACB9S0S6_9MYRT|nr:hypothetical protein MLD38_003041 [Melastoma candidum]